MIPYSCDDGRMCGRYASTKSASDIAAEFDAVDATASSELAAPGPDYNVAPTKPVFAVVARHPRDAEGTPDRSRTERSVRVMRWGLVPYWAKDPSVGSRMFNARSETAAEKPAYRKAMVSRRCLLPADGWYEWQRLEQDGSGRPAKQPFFVTGTEGASLAMAGVWEFWRSSDGGDPLVTSAVLTTAAIAPLDGIHERMPLLVPRRGWADWLDPDTGPTSDQVAALLNPSVELIERLELRPVSDKVNNVRNEGPELWERAEVAGPEPTQQALSLDLR
jgi:putative SOS response-associated peptidase YedK